MKKIFFVALFIFICSSLVFAQISDESNRLKNLRECMSKMSVIQTYLEFYYMSAGIYPKSLRDLNFIFNSDVRKESERIVFPEDPASGKQFVYTLSSDLKTYRLEAPDPSLYGLEEIVLSNVNWGWMNKVAKQISIEAKTELCGHYMTGIVQTARKYQQDNKKLPSKIEEMIPKYLKAVPKCPLSGKNYILKLTSADLIVGCPDPNAHGMRDFQYTLKKGIIIKPLEEKNGD